MSFFLENIKAISPNNCMNIFLIIYIKYKFNNTIYFKYIKIILNYFVCVIIYLCVIWQNFYFF
jgi:hypothetical protein